MRSFRIFMVYMSKQSLFEHIRSEDVVLWTGAGFSRYAGYPLGGELASIIVNALSEEERKLINTNLPLPDLAEEFVRLKDGVDDELLKLINDIYAKEPESLDDHKAVKAIPQFKTIVTTNYDRLFETVYGDEGNLVFRETDISSLHKTKVNIIKIHGDLSDLKSLVLTKSNYNSFYRQDWGSPFWSHLATLMATKVILFVGYSLEDPNVLSMVEHIAKYLKDTRKEMFFVAPHIPKHRVTQLKRIGVEAIEMTGAAILAEIEADIRLNIFGDQRRQKLSTETFDTYFKNQNLYPEYRSTPEGLQVTGVRTLDGKPIKGMLKAAFVPNKAQNKLFQSFIDGETHELKVNADMLENFSLDLAGIRFLGLDELGELVFRRQPEVYSFDLTFPGLGLELENLKATVLKGRNAVIKITIHNLDIHINFGTDAQGNRSGNLQIQRNPTHLSVKSALEAYHFVQYFFTKKPFTVFFHNGTSMSNHAEKADLAYAEKAGQYIEYFKLMKKVEEFFGIRFRNIDDLNHENLEKLQRLASIADGDPFELTDGPIRLTMSHLTKKGFELYDRLVNEDVPIDVEFKMSETVEVHGQTITLTRQRIHVPSAEILNLAALKNKKTRTIEVKSRKNKIYTYYEESPKSADTQQI